LSDAVSLKMVFKQMVCFTADQIEEMDLTRVGENARVSSPSSDEGVSFGVLLKLLVPINS
jgi:hypothetical protein